jgi:hypothetical protein
MVLKPYEHIFKKNEIRFWEKRRLTALLITLAAPEYLSMEAMLLIR